MDTQTETAARWYVTSTPNVDDKLVDSTASGHRADEQAQASVWTVVRANHSTGRGTVQHATSGRKLQVVRGRFGWCLADGTARPVRFAQPPRETSDGTPLFGDDVAVECEPFSPTYETVLLDEPAPCERCGGGDTVATSTGQDLCAWCWSADQPTPIVSATDSPTHGELVWLAATAPEQLLAPDAPAADTEDGELDALAAELGADAGDVGGWVQYLADLACSGDRSVALLPEAALEGALDLSGSALATRTVWAASERLLALSATRAARAR